MDLPNDRSSDNVRLAMIKGLIGEEDDAISKPIRMIRLFGYWAVYVERAFVSL